MRVSERRVLALLTEISIFIKKNHETPVIRYRFILFILAFILNVNIGLAQGSSINWNEYAEHLRGMWLGECIANWTGIQTEGDRIHPPFFTDSDWSSYGFILNQDPWLADDDTDIEYVYLHLLNKYFLTTLTPDLIRDGWMNHINRMIWVSNARVRELFDQGVLPPATSLLNANELAIQIDAQLTTEFFGALAPGMPHKALQMANLPILTTANSHAAHASQFYVILYSLASLMDTLSLSGREQALWLVDEARKYIPDSSKAVDIIDLVRNGFVNNPDVNDWESTRDKIYERYQLNDSANGFCYAGWTESSVNFATGVMCLLYGEMDYRKTIKIGTLSGWDSDNPTATMGGLLGLIYGYDSLVAEFPEIDSFSDRYNVYRTRDALPDYLPDDPDAEDTFTLMADRMLHIIDLAVKEAGGSVQGDEWILPQSEEPGVELNPLYELMQRSANNTVRDEGGSVSVHSSAGGTNIDAIADGFEHNFWGREWMGNTVEYNSNSIDTARISVTYDRPVEIHTIRLIEGNDPVGFSSAEVEIFKNNSWISPPEGIIQSVSIDANQELQIVDFVLSTPIEAKGISISGSVSGWINILELDALSAPWDVSGNLPPTVSITSPCAGDIFYAPATITINADANDRDGNIRQVEFYSDSTKLGEDISSPYSYTWNNVSSGIYNLMVKAIDDGSAVISSSPVWVMVEQSYSVESIWHSYDVMTISGFQPVTVMDENHENLAAVELYESINAGGVERGRLFSCFNNGAHVEEFNRVQDFWSNTSGPDAYPYAGKSTIERGSDDGETEAPSPEGVYDLQLHPPESEHLIVAAFIVPFDGIYTVSDLAVRRVDSQGNLVVFKVFDDSKNEIVRIQAMNDQIWMKDDSIYNFGALRGGDRIYFAVDKGENDYFWWDATEISWTVKKSSESSEEDSVGGIILYGNYPNPFNEKTEIQYELAVSSKINLSIYNLLGQKIRTLQEGIIMAGIHTITWDGSDELGHPVSSGIYFARLKTAEETFIQKMVFIR